MRVRAFGMLLLVLVGLVPLGAFAWVSIRTSERTAVSEVRAANQRLADSVAHRIASFAEQQRGLLAAIGAAAVDAPTPEAAQNLLDDFGIDYRNFTDMTVYRADGSKLAGPGIDGADEVVKAAVAGRATQSKLSAAGSAGAERFAHLQIVGAPIVVAGEKRGAIVANVALVDTWSAINAIRVGKRGFARLLSDDGTLLAHGDPEERRSVYAADRRDEDRAIVSAALSGAAVTNHQGEEIVAGVAPVPDRGWVVVVEQPVSEAFAAARDMKRTLVVICVAALVIVIVVGVLFGGRLVRSMERLRAHTGVLAQGDLDARVDTNAPVVELSALANSLNDMAASLRKLHDEAKAKERLSTFARVAAGLAHDLRTPIEAVRAACHQLNTDPDDPDARELFDWVTERELPKLKRYVDDLQRIAQEGKVRLELSEIAPRDLVDELVDDLRGIQKWSSVEFAADGTASMVVADANLVRRALYNLAANAADACTQQGPGGRVELHVRDAEGEEGWVEFSVRDNGGGIAPETLEQLLEGDFKSTKRSSGVGLGFGVARHVAQAHGGEIRAESEVGAGSTFCLRVARADTTGSIQPTSDPGDLERRAMSPPTH